MKKNKKEIVKKINSKQVVVSDNTVGQRIDNFLIRYFGKIPKSRIYQMLRRGEVRVNKCRIKQTYKLGKGDIVRIPPIFIDKQNKNPPSRGLQQKIIDAIIYEDDSLIVVNKPVGVVVHGGSDHQYGVIEAIRSYSEEYKKIELVHRLDKDTSGCLILAKRIPILRILNRMIQTGEICKTYSALLAGRLLKKRYVVDQPLNKNKSHLGKRIVEVDATGKKARTIFFRDKVYEEATLVNVALLTGRMHQIRVHSAHINHPVIGDLKYGDKDINLHFKRLGLKRLFLHAKSLQFVLPDTNKKIHIEAPLDSELAPFLKKLTIQSRDLT